MVKNFFLLTPPEPTFVPVDAPAPSVLVCAYTGKEVVECKVQMAVVAGAKDQVRWLRLRAVALSGAPGRAARPDGMLQPAHYR